MAAAELAEGGHLVTEADSPSAALTLIDGGLRPDALITDLTVSSGLDGLDLFLTARARLPLLPAVLVAGPTLEAASGKIVIAARSGPFTVVQKPASVATLVGHLESMLHAPD